MHFAVIGLSHVHVLAMTQVLLGVPGVVCDGFSPEETPAAGGSRACSRTCPAAREMTCWAIQVSTSFCAPMSMKFA